MINQSIRSFIRKVLIGRQDEYRIETLVEAVHLVFQHQKQLAFKLILVPIVIAVILWGHVDNTAVILWAILSILVRIIGYWQGVYFLKQKLSNKDTLRWGWYYTVFTFVLGVAYGSAVMLFFSSELPLAQQLAILVIIMGYTSGAISIMSHWLPSFYAFMLPVLIMIAIQLLFQSDSTYKLLSLVPIVQIILVFSMSRAAQQSLLSTIQIRFENAELLKKLKISKKKAEEANKQKTRFLASASHDLRQPVHALELFSVSLNDEPLSSKGCNTLSYMKDCIGSLNDLLSSLLDISRLDAGIVEPNFGHIDVSQLIKRVVNNLGNQAEKKGLQLRVHTQELWVNSDSVLLESTIRNLLTNAIKYTNEGGILIACRSRQGEVWVEIWDTGIGISEKELRNIFDEFYQVDNAERDRSQGLGLGLSIVTREMDMLGHIFSLHSREGKGTMVRIKLQGVPPSSSVEASAIKVSYDRLASKNILIIDDDESILKATKSLVTNWKCHAEIASDFDNASTICKYFTPDIIISDFRLRDHVTGIDVIEQLRLQLGFKVPAILITGDTAPDRLRQAKESELILLHKPVKPAKLRVAINMTLDTK